MRAPYWTAQEVADNCGWSLAYVYRQAARHSWRKANWQGTRYYLILDVQAARRNADIRPGVNPFDTLSA